jgi:hypothetical protein
VLTDQRVLFYPHWFDRAAGGKRWECTLESITGLGTADRGSDPFDGSLRRRLRIDCGDSAEYFVVNNGEAISTAIKETTDS